MFRIYLEDDAGNVKIVPVEASEVSIGRSEDNVIVLPDRNVSRHHARLRAVNGRFFLEDAGARYGLFLNGSRVDGQHEVRFGDLIGIGDYKIKVLPAEASEDESRAPSERVVTVPGIPAMSDRVEVPALEPEFDTGVISLRDMERVARYGWPSDFDETEQKKSFTRRLIVLGFLIVIAAILVWTYLWVVQPTEPETFTTAPARVETVEPAPVGGGPSAFVPLPPTAPKEVEPPEGASAHPDKPFAETPRPEAPLPSFAQPAEVGDRKQSPQTKREARPVAVAETRPRSAPPPASPGKPAQTPGSPIPTASGTGDALAQIEAAIATGRLSEAEGLLAQCRQSACASAWKKLGDRYQASGQHRKAISAYERARTLTRDAALKAWLERKIKSIQDGL